MAVLRAIAGAKSVHRELIPVWTMPGNEATVGHLTSEFHSMVTGAGLRHLRDLQLRLQLEHVGRLADRVGATRGDGGRVRRRREG